MTEESRDGEVLIEVKGMKKWFPIKGGMLSAVKSYVRAVDGVDLQIKRGETLGIVGESGCGKTTLGRVLLGLIPITDGSVLYDGEDIRTIPDRELRRRMQIVFQDPGGSMNPRMSVRAIVGEPLQVNRLAEGAELTQKVADVLDSVGLKREHMNRFPHEFSGGQRQRIAIARALSSKPEFIVCDEPTSALDVSVQAQILNLMRDLQDEFGLTYLLISHDLSVVRHMATRIGVLYLGRLVEVAQGKRLFAEPQHPYTRMLLDAVPDLALSGRRRRPVEGEIPNPISPPSGCAFHPRCPLAFDRCRTEIPQPRPTPAGQAACHALDDMVSA